MQQTPVHDTHNPDLLRLVPVESAKLIEIGFSSGALAKAFKAVSPACHYLGVDIDPSYVELALRHCDAALAMNIDDAPDEFFESHRDRDCWIFGDTLEHLKDPWRVLHAIRANMPEGGMIVACIPNAQHWSMLARLSVGDFRYEETGLMDKTHLRWFTRHTIIEMFSATGFRIVEGFPRVFNEPNRELFLPIIGELAKAAGGDPEEAINDSMPLQYVIRAVPE